MYSKHTIANLILSVAAMCGAIGHAATVSVREPQRCRSEEYRTPDSPEVTSVKRDGETIVVSVIATAVCGGVNAEAPEVTISGNSIALSWLWVGPKGGPVTACRCGRHLEFRIEGGPNGDVAVTAGPRSK
jgi:hypothetical protein